MNEVDQCVLDAIERLTEKAHAALARGEKTVTMTLPAAGWLVLFDEIRDRRPRNYSSLIRDDFMDRLNEAIERLHDEANFLIASNPKPIADRMARHIPPSTADVAAAMGQRGHRQWQQRHRTRRSDA